MDLYAYSQIDDLEKIAKANKIDVPRCRGYRLMKDEDKVSQEEIDRIIKESEYSVVEDLCASSPFWNPHAYIHTLSSWTDYLKEYYLEDGNIRWDRIHGWKRRILKFELKKNKHRIQKTFDTWNKYAGREDVLYIHARIGGNNWNYFKGPERVAKQPWFLDKVDDYFDSTYCDIYAKINPDVYFS